MVDSLEKKTASQHQSFCRKMSLVALLCSLGRCERRRARGGPLATKSVSLVWLTFVEACIRRTEYSVVYQRPARSQHPWRSAPKTFYSTNTPFFYADLTTPEWRPLLVPSSVHRPHLGAPWVSCELALASRWTSRGGEAGR